MLKINYKYDKTKPYEIEKYAKELIGYTFKDVQTASTALDEFSDNIGTYSAKTRKGGLGNLLEEQYFGYKANSTQDVDFPQAGVELKVTPYEKNKKGILRAGERLVITMINFNPPVEENFYSSHVWNKTKLMLLIYYLRDKSFESNLDYSIDYVTLFSPPLEDLKIIEADYNKIISKIVSGKAHELSEGDTMYLGACTKGSTAEKSIVVQSFAPYLPAKRRAFSLKNSYMTYILNSYITKDIKTYEHIIKDLELLDEVTFEEYIINEINKNIGKSDFQLSKEYDLEYSGSKAQWITLAYKMLGVKSNRAEEFVKANITVKAIRIEENGVMKESSSLPNLVFKELVEEEWENSKLYEYFEETKFLFVVFKKEGNYYTLKGAKLWNMPVEDMEIASKGWENIRNIVREGVELTKMGNFINNNFPTKKDNDVIHIRPHASKSYYVFEDKSVFGSGKINNADELPDGRWMTKQSFWLNNTYIMKQIEELIDK